MVSISTLEYLHRFYVASDLSDLDAAFDDGKQRALRTLEKRMAEVRLATRTDYEHAFLGQAVVKQNLTTGLVDRNKGDPDGSR